MNSWRCDKIVFSHRPWSISLLHNRLLVTPLNEDCRVEVVAEPEEQELFICTADEWGEFEYYCQLIADITKETRKTVLPFPIDMDKESAQRRQRRRLYVFDVGASWPSKFEDGNLIHEVVLSTDFNSHVIHHSVETNRGTFVVCHSSNHSADEPDCSRQPTFDWISEVNATGHSIRVYGGQRGDRLGWPNHLVLLPPDAHSNSDYRLLVGEKSSCRIVILKPTAGDSAELDVERVLVGQGKDGMSIAPARLGYSPENGWLVVGFEDGKINAYC